MLRDILFFLAGLVCAGFGGEFFVRSIVAGARAARVAPGLIAATIAAFATSSPELAIAINAASAGVPQISLGDALGSNVVNVALVLAIPLAAMGLSVSREAALSDLPFALFVPFLIGAVAIDGTISRLDGIILLLVFIAWLILAIRRGAKNKNGLAREAERLSGARIASGGLTGFVLLLLAGYLIVEGAQGMAHSFGIPDFIIGATVVALGTSVPELATVIVATIRKHEDVGIRAILGSNLFNGLVIVPVAALIHPIATAWDEIIIALVAGFITLAAAIPGPSPQLGRWRGLLLLLFYAGFVGAMVFRPG